VLGLGDVHAVTEARRVFLLIIVATIPVLIVGFILEHPLRRIFATPMIAAVFLVVNGLLLLVGERLKGQPAQLRALSSLRPMDAFVIGLWQCLALIPGLSRSGVTILGGVLRGVDHEGSAHFSFLIATPVIIAAAVLEVPKLLHDTAAKDAMSLAVVSAVVAGVTALASTAFLMRWFRGHDRWAMTPFAIYCVIAGLGSMGFLLLAG
jgi:undecaprenyl-diphosphatase